MLELPTDLVILPNSADASMPLWADFPVIAAATGFIYFDDGKTLNQAPVRFDFYLSIDATNPKIVFKKTQPGFSTPYATKNTNLGVIKILFTSEINQLQNLQNAIVKFVGGIPSISVPVTYSSGDVLVIDTTAKSVNFYDLDTISLS